MRLWGKLRRRTPSEGGRTLVDITLQRLIGRQVSSLLAVYFSSGGSVDPDPFYLIFPEGSDQYVGLDGGVSGRIRRRERPFDELFCDGINYSFAAPLLLTMHDEPLGSMTITSVRTVVSAFKTDLILALDEGRSIIITFEDDQIRISSRPEPAAQGSIDT